MESTHTLHALIVGINEFQYQNDLKACVNDANAMADYLRKNVGSLCELKIHHLYNEEATKSGIIDAFQTHLIEAAEEGDTALFFFSGHGGQEEAPEVFLKYEADNLLDGIICYDTGRGEGERSLVDKELRYLLHKLSQKKCDIVTVFDCCHSGDSIRDDGELLIRRLTKPAKKRKWEEFIFTQDPIFANPDVFIDNNLDDLIPPVKHIHFAACKDSELAYEHPKYLNGVFTYHLIEELEKVGGNISYLALQRRLLHQMNLKKYKQNPQIFAHKAYHGEIFNAFLGGLGDDSFEANKTKNRQLLTGQLGYDQFKRKWILNLGGIHGLVARDDETQMVSIVGEDDRQVSAFITKVETASCELELTDRQALNKRMQYDAYIDGLMLDPVSIYVNGEEKGVSVALAYADKQLEKLKEYNIHLTDDINQASYQLIAENGQYIIAYPWDDRPLVRQIRGYSDLSMRRVMSKFRHIAQWVFTKNLAPLGPSTLSQSPVLFTLHSSKGEQIVMDAEKGPISLEYLHPDESSDIQKYAFHFKNQSSEALYVACLYLDRLFQVEVNYLQPNVVYLEPEAEVWGINGNFVPLRLPDYIRDFNWPEEPLYFKIIASTQPFEVDTLTLPALKSPTRQENNIQLVKEFDPDKDTAELHEWNTQLIEIRVKNPLYESG